MSNELRDQVGRAIHDAIQSGTTNPDWNDSREIDRLADAAMTALRPHKDVSKTEPVICYFATEDDREEFIQAMMEIKPDMRSIKV